MQSGRLLVMAAAWLASACVTRAIETGDAGHREEAANAGDPGAAASATASENLESTGANETSNPSAADTSSHDAETSSASDADTTSTDSGSDSSVPKLDIFVPTECDLMSPSDFTISGTVPGGDPNSMVAWYSYDDTCHRQLKVVLLPNDDLPESFDVLPESGVRLDIRHPEPSTFDSSIPWLGSFPATGQSNVNGRKSTIEGFVGVVDAPHRIGGTHPVQIHFDVVNPSAGWDLHVAGTFTFCQAFYHPASPCE